MKPKTCGTCGNPVASLWRAKTKDKPSACKQCASKEKVSVKPRIKVIKPISDKQDARLVIYRRERDE